MRDISCILYSVAQIKRRHFTFLLLTNECIYKILWMHSFVTSKNVKWRRLIWATLYVFTTGMCLVKEATLTNEKLRQFVAQQKTVVTDQLSCITQLRHDLTSTRSSLSQLRAEREYRDAENDQLVSTLQLQLQAVSRWALLVDRLIESILCQCVYFSCRQLS